MGRKDIDLGVGDSHSGISIQVHRKGIDVFGWYDHFVGLEGPCLTWEQIDAARADVMKVTRRSAWGQSVVGGEANGPSLLESMEEEINARDADCAELRSEILRLSDVIDQVRNKAMLCRSADIGGHEAAYDPRSDMSIALDELFEALDLVCEPPTPEVKSAVPTDD